MLRVATVLSAREWEARFVAAARDSAAVRLVLRAYLPDEVAERSSDIDVVIAGAETPWVTPSRIASWRRLGMRVVGIHQRTDTPAVQRFSAGGVDLTLEETLGSERMVREIRLLDPSPTTGEPRDGRVIAVSGPRGGPGRTEVAVGLAWTYAGRGKTLLLDADLEAPSLAVRLGLPPRPNLADCVDRALRGDPIVELVQQRGRLEVVVGPEGDSGIGVEVADDIAQGFADARTVIVDCGPWSREQQALPSADEHVFVVDASPIGIVRAARALEGWNAAAPTLVMNKVRRNAIDDVTSAVRRWTGLEPVTRIPLHSSIHAAAATASGPHRRLLKAVYPITERAHADA